MAGGLLHLHLALLLAALPPGRPAAAVAAVPAPAKPNVLYIIGDDMRPAWNTYCPSCGLHTPNFDRLASEGLLFERAMCQEAFCSASRNSFMTGRRTGPVQPRER